MRVFSSFYRIFGGKETSRASIPRTNDSLKEYVRQNWNGSGVTNALNLKFIHKKLFFLLIIIS